MTFLSGKRIVVTGGAGFLGRAVCDALQPLKTASIFVPRSADYDLRDRRAIRELLHQHQPEVVIHLAAKVGGIGANRAAPGEYFYDNAIMGIELIEQCRLAGVQKMVLAGSVCSYPKLAATPFQEDDLWNGYPEETNAPYGLAKKMLLVQSEAYRQQYDFNSINLLLTNLYGPGDNFDLDSGHVIPALIRRIHEAKINGTNTISVWGTGAASRTFLYVEDAAKAIVGATEHYNQSRPVNLGSEQEVDIRTLAELICELSDFHGTLQFDYSKPDGQPRRCLNTSQAKNSFGFEATTSLRDGLAKTINWYQQQQAT